VRRFAAPLAALAVVAILVIGLIQASSGPKQEKLKPVNLDQALKHLEGAAAPLAALHADHNKLLGGGLKAFKARLEGLRGHPVVINKWGSWCPPCRQEFPLLQHVSTDRGKRVAFLGIDALDPADEARKLLDEVPLTYPSYKDPKGLISQDLGVGGGSAPITVFVDRQGKTAFIHQGVYKRRADLERDIDRYL
jgi:cytochrome c biogenesis protein CcmG/thiol:disulfide interchange protein DsbE